MATSNATSSEKPAGPVLLEDQNRALVQRIYSLKEKKSELEKDIHATAALKVVLEEHIELVRQRIARAKQTLEAKTALRAEYHSVIEEMDSAYNGLIGESVQLLEHIDMETFRINDDRYYEERAKQQVAASSSRVQEPPGLLMMNSVTGPSEVLATHSSEKDDEYALGLQNNTRIPKPNNTPTKAMPPTPATPPRTVDPPTVPATKAVATKTTAEVRARADVCEIRDQ